MRPALKEVYMLTITPAVTSEVTNVACPACREKLPRVGIPKGSTIDTFTFRCRRCGRLWAVKTDK